MIEIKENHGRLAVFIDGKLDNHGFMREEDALHSVWIDKGANPEHFYKCVDGKVFLDITPFQNR